MYICIYIYNKICPLKVQISEGLDPLFQIELSKVGLNRRSFFSFYRWYCFSRCLSIVDIIQSSICFSPASLFRTPFSAFQVTPNLPTKIIPTKIAWLRLSGRLPMGLGIPSLKIRIMLESNPLKSRVLVWRLAPV